MRTMNNVLSSYGQLCGCPEILKKSRKFFCRGLDIRVPDVMHSYPFYPDPFTYAVDLPVHIGICQRNDSIRLFQAINPLRVILDMVTQKVRNRDLSYTIFSFRRCGYILAVVSVESFGYVDNLFIQVDICRSECKSFPQTQAGII